MYPVLWGHSLVPESAPVSGGLRCLRLRRQPAVARHSQRHRPGNPHGRNRHVWPAGGGRRYGLCPGALPHRSGVRLQPVPAGGGGAVTQLWYYAGADWLKGRLGRGAAVPYPAGSGSPLLQKTESASGLVRAQGAYFWFQPGAGGGGTAGERVSGNFRADRNTMAKERRKTIRAAPAEDRRGQKRNTAFPRCNRPSG